MNCQHYIDRSDGRYYCELPAYHDHGHSCEASVNGHEFFVQWQTGDPGDHVRER